jgi:hypothetical protein
LQRPTAKSASGVRGARVEGTLNICRNKIRPEELRKNLNIIFCRVFTEIYFTPS